MTLEAKLIALLLAVLCFVGSCWYAYHAGEINATNALTAKYESASLVAAKEAADKTKDLQDQLDKANHDAKDRETKLTADADHARSAANGLQHNLDAVRASLPRLTEQAVRQYADTASIVFGQCTNRYTDLAKKADAIDSDRQTLEQGWPK